MSLLPIIPLPIGTNITQLLVKLAELVVTDLCKAALSYLAEAVAAVTRDAMQAALATTSISAAEGNGWFSSVEEALFPVELLVVGPLIFAATIGCIFRQDSRRLARVWGAGVPLSLTGGFLAVKLTGKAIGVTDALSSAIEHAVDPNLGNDFIGAITFGITHPSPGVTPIVSLVALCGGLALWLELVLRAAAVELAIFFMPLAFAGLVWPATAHWAKRLLEVLAALLLSKPVIVGALCLGANALTSQAAGPSSLVTGTAILLMAAFAPFALLKLVPMVEMAGIAHLQGMSRQPVHAAERSVQRLVAAVSAAATTGANLAASGAGAGAGTAEAESARQLLGLVDRDPPSDGHGLGPAGPPPNAAAAGVPPRGAGAVPVPDAPARPAGPLVPGAPAEPAGPLASVGP